MIQLKTAVDKCRLSLVDGPVFIAEGCENYVQLTCELDSDWQEMTTITANFRRHDEQTVYSVEMTEGACIVPKSFIRWPEFHLSLFGTNGTVRITTSILYVPILKSELGESLAPEPDTPDVFDSILATAQEAVEIAQSVRDDADAGEFDGEAFSYYAVYESVADMNAAADSIPENAYVYVNPGDVEDVENGRIYRKVSGEMRLFGDISGPTGASGTTFTPSVSAEGVISWTNDKGLQNPESVNIKGPQGDPGAPGAVGQGVPTGGAQGQVLTKASATDYDTQWTDPAGGGVGVPIATTAGTVPNYTVTIPEFEGLSLAELEGRPFVIIPHATAMTTTPTLSVNGLAAGTISLAGQNSNESPGFLSATSIWLGYPVMLMFNGSTSSPRFIALSLNPVPTGGTAGQVLTKDTANSYDVSWQTLYGVPTGGSAGQVLTKDTATNYDVSWQDAPTGENPTIICGPAANANLSLNSTDTALSLAQTFSEYDPGSIIYHTSSVTYVRVPGNRRLRLSAQARAVGLTANQNVALSVYIGTAATLSSQAFVCGGISSGGTGIVQVTSTPYLYIPPSSSTYKYITLRARSTDGGGLIQQPGEGAETFLCVEVLGAI